MLPAPNNGPDLTAEDRYLLEHGLSADGRPDAAAKDVGELGSFETFFTETGNGKYVPRSLFVDLDPSVLSPRKDSLADAERSHSLSTKSELAAIGSCSTQTSWLAERKTLPTIVRYLFDPGRLAILTAYCRRSWPLHNWKRAGGHGR